MRSRSPLIALAAISALSAQTPSPPTIEQVLERLNRLESENRALREEVRGLREEVAALKPASAAAAPTPVQQLEERLAIQEKRVEEQAQTKVEAAQRFPIRLSGMVLMNAFHNGPASGGADTPTFAVRATGRQTGGITFRQSILGMEYTGSQTFLGARARGSVFVDFYEGNTETTNFYTVRFRTGGFHLDWAARTLSFVQEKPLFSGRDPDSFSFVGVSPLTASGNLWRWQPQLRFEQRIGSGAVQGRAQVALVQTSEDAAFDFAGNRLSNERRRPGLQGRFEVSAGTPGERRIEIAPGFHLSNSNVSGQQYRSDLVSVDWLVSPFSKLKWTGLAWSGQNVHHFGALRQSFGLVNGVLRPVRSRGGWTQASVPFTSKLSLNLFGGLHDDRNEDIAPTGIAANRSGGANLMYRLAPHIVLTLEAMKQRTTYRDIGNRSNNRYDLSIAYLF
jgi:hypothetical protein